MGSCGVSDVPLAALPRSPVANSSLLGVQGKVLSRAGGLLCSSRSLPEDKVVSLLHSSSGPCWMRAGVVRAAPSRSGDAICCLSPPCEMMDAQVSTKDFQQQPGLRGCCLAASDTVGSDFIFKTPSASQRNRKASLQYSKDPKWVRPAGRLQNKHR